MQKDEAMYRRALEVEATRSGGPEHTDAGHGQQPGQSQSWLRQRCRKSKPNFGGCLKETRIYEDQENMVEAKA